MKSIYLLIPFLFAQFLFVLSTQVLAQSTDAPSRLPIIKATSKRVAINDGGYRDTNAWTLSPGARPDIFTAERTRKAKWVTFYTDIDSIRVKVKPGTKYDFVILLNGKDSCFTRIESAIAAENTAKGRIATADTIPFTLSSYNAIHVRAVINAIDTVNLHFDIGSFDFRLTREAIAKNERLQKVSSIQMGSLTWRDPVVVPTGVTAHEMDGRFGWNLFEGKIVEIDYDNNRLIVQSKLPKAVKGYRRSKLAFIHSFVCVKGKVEIANKRYDGSFLLDTGSDQALILDSAWAIQHNFPTDLPLIRSSVIKDPRGVKYETKTVLVPLLEINDFRLTNIPAFVLSGKNPTGFAINFLGNDLLKRFNLILDFKNDYLYLKPNKLIKLKYAAIS